MYSYGHYDTSIEYGDKTIDVRFMVKRWDVPGKGDNAPEREDTVMFWQILDTLDDDVEFAVDNMIGEDPSYFVEWGEIEWDC